MNSKSAFPSVSKLKRVFSCALAVILSMAFFIPLNIQTAFAEPTSAEVQAQADEVSARLAVAEEEMAKIGVEYQAAIVAHEDAVAAMNEAQARIDAAEIIISETQERLNGIAAQQYRQGPYSFLDVVFGASSFSEFLSSWEYINFANQENAELIQANKDARAEAEDARTEYAAQEQAAAQYEAEQADLMARAEEKVAQQEAEYAALSAEVAALVEQEQQKRVEQAAAATTTTTTTGNTGTTGGGNPGPGPIDASSVVAAAQSRVGCPYVYGATGPDSFDCSGFTQWCYRTALGRDIGRTTGAQYANASASWPYSQGGAEPGDVLWWPASSGYTHVALYVGGGQYIHSPVPGQTVCYSSWYINETIVLRF